jgi:uncharacterized OB-fold protein
MSEAAPYPEVDWDLIAPFWQAAARSELSIPRCVGCERYVWYPSERCPRCKTEAPVWTTVSGRAELFSWAIVERALYKPFRDRVPYITALVTLEEDSAVRLVTLLRDIRAEDLEIGLPMRVVFDALSFGGDERSVPAPFFSRA